MSGEELQRDVRSSFVSSALYTTPMPPSPSFSMMRYCEDTLAYHPVYSIMRNPTLRLRLRYRRFAQLATPTPSGEGSKRVREGTIRPTQSQTKGGMRRRTRWVRQFPSSLSDLARDHVWGRAPGGASSGMSNRLLGILHRSEVLVQPGQRFLQKLICRNKMIGRVHHQALVLRRRSEHLKHRLHI